MHYGKLIICKIMKIYINLTFSRRDKGTGTYTEMAEGRDNVGHRMGLDPRSILYRFCHALWKWSHMPVAVVIFKHLCPLIGFRSGYVVIEHLTGLISHLMIPTGG
jgi:hypothetical protein